MKTEKVKMTHRRARESKKIRFKGAWMPKTEGLIGSDYQHGRSGRSHNPKGQ